MNRLVQFDTALVRGVASVAGALLCAAVMLGAALPIVPIA